MSDMFKRIGGCVGGSGGGWLGRVVRKGGQPEPGHVFIKTQAAVLCL